MKLFNGIKNVERIRSVSISSISFIILIPIVLGLAVCRKIQLTDDDDPIIPIDFENSSRLTENISDIMPRWSQFARQVAFERSGNVYIYDIHSGGLSFEAKGHTPFWSPDGDQLGFIRDGEIYVIHLTPERPVNKLTLGAYASSTSGCDWNISNQIVFFQEAGIESTGRKLAIYYIASDTFQWIISDDLGLAEIPRWSPVGRCIIFSSPVKGICLYDVITQELKEKERITAAELM